jgi:hypothetical protein
MLPESCFGIDLVDGHWLVVVERREGKTCYGGRFENTAEGLTDLLRFIQDRGTKPKVCITPTDRAALTIALHLCRIPQVEVILLSRDGLRLHRSRLRSTETRASEAGNLVVAETLARTAERMI